MSFHSHDSVDETSNVREMLDEGLFPDPYTSIERNKLEAIDRSRSDSFVVLLNV